MDVKVGTRVGAIESVKDGVARVYGFGVYDGEVEVSVTSETEGERGFSIMNPRILLDNGKHVLGLQCWWAPENDIKKILENKQIEYVEVPQL